jgi:hypothetical protein
MIRRNIEDSIQQAMTDAPIVLLNGARQTGKTTLAYAMWSWKSRVPGAGRTAGGGRNAQPLHFSPD